MNAEMLPEFERKRVIQRQKTGSVVLEVLECGHVGAVVILTRGQNVPVYPTHRVCLDCREKRKRKQ